MSQKQVHGPAGDRQEEADAVEEQEAAEEDEAEDEPLERGIDHKNDYDEDDDKEPRKHYNDDVL